jgi:hypothetical protein
VKLRKAKNNKPPESRGTDQSSAFYEELGVGLIVSLNWQVERHWDRTLNVEFNTTNAIAGCSSYFA